MTPRVSSSGELPEGWIKASINDICRLVTKGSTPTSYGYKYVNEGINFTKVENIRNGTINLPSIKEFITSDAHNFLKRSQLQANDVLFSIAGTIGRVGIVKDLDLPANTNQAVSIIRCPWQFIAPKYLALVLASPITRLAIEQRPRGVGMNNLSLGDIKDLTIPIPPFSEQNRIVAKIEELFTNLDAGVDALKKVQAQIKRYRQAVLKYAFEGKLTAEWREANKDELEPASVLLERIREERKKKLGGKYKEPPAVDTSNLPELPEGWAWTRAGEISDRIQYGTSEKANTDSTGIPVIRMGNIQDGQITLESLKYFPRDSSWLEDFILEEGDVLFNRTNSAELVGKTAVYKKVHPITVFASYLIRVKVDSDKYNPDLLSYFINSLYGRKYISSVVSQQVGQANVNGTKLAAMPIPLFTKAEQEFLVREVQRRLSIADSVERTIQQGLQQSDRFRRSILKKAFEGKLVSQDPNDEPAHRLLKRIEEERAKQAAESKKAKGKKGR